jgi:formylglycine-generating enzyme required for sulfatase activity
VQITKNVPQDGLLNGRFGCALNSILMALALTLTLHVSVAETAPVGKKILNSSAPKGMVLIPGGKFLMGSDKALSRPDERPVHQVKVDPFWMDTTEVTNAQFKSFVEATHYVTTAEIPPRMEDIMAQLPPGSEQPPAESLQAGSLVFAIPKGVEYWWQWVNGADWRHPEGPLSHIDGKDNYPVVQVSWFDAVTYAKWEGNCLPTEAEW